MPLLRRSRKNWIPRTVLFLFVAWCILDIARYHFLQFSPISTQRSTAQHDQRIFIASTHWNNEAILKNYWNDAILQLVQHFGTDNVFVSIVESGSWDNSKQVLRELGKELESIGAQFQIILDEATHEQEIAKTPAQTGWIDTPRGRKELRRIPYLARSRNLSLEPLHTLAQKGTTFNRILFLNDVIFTLDDVLNLLDTRGGKYAAACALDFSKPPAYYDTFALRDFGGHEALMPTWPYFRSSVSRSAIKRGDAVPVSSCWNGMVAMQAMPFYRPTGGEGLTFRGISDSLAENHLEGSECCLIHQDNPLSLSDGVFVNPHVRVGYNLPAFEAMNGRAGEVSLFQFLIKSWENRFRRWATTDWFKLRVVKQRLAQWKKADSSRSEPGVDCLINEMQVLVANGWAHV